MPTLTIAQAANYFGKDGPLAAQMRKAAQKGLLSAALRMKQVLVTREVPKIVPAPIDKGIYRAGWQVEKLPRGAAVYNAVPYAVFIEYGVKGGNVVLGNKFQLALAEWVRRKLGKSGGIRATGRSRAAGAKKTHQQRVKQWRERIRELKRKNAARKAKKLPPVALPAPPKPPKLLQGAAKNPAYDYAWRVAGAIMHAMKKRGIFNRGAGTRVMEKFVKAHGSTIVREEVQRALDKELA